MMADINSSSSTKHNDDGPNYFAYYKHLLLDQISQTDDCSGEETKENFAGGKGIKVSGLCESSPIFSEAVGVGLSDLKKERLLRTLNESVVCLNQEVNEMVDHVLATLKTESNQKQVSNAILNEDEDLMTPFNLRKRKSQSLNPKQVGSKSSSARQVYNGIRALQGSESLADSEKCKLSLLTKLDNMSHNLEDYLNTTVSKCRAMTIVERHQLGKMIRKLPAAAFDRVVEILQPNKISADGFPERITVNLEEQDNGKLWRLYCYAELVLKTNNL